MSDKYIFAGILIFVLICWAIFVAVWRSAQRTLREWRGTIKKDDRCYFINTLGEKAFVKVIAVDRSKPRDVQVEMLWGGHTSTPWIESSQLYPNPQKEIK